MITPGACHALVLAAGEGRRFGGDKLEARLRGRPLLDHVLEVVRAARAGGLLEAGVVVLRSGAPAAARVEAAGLEPLENAEPAAGLSRSLKLGLDRLEALRGAPAAAAMVFLADQPEVRLETVERLLERWRGGSAWCVRPRYAAAAVEPGHPVLLDRRAWAAARAAEGDAGAGGSLAALPGGVELVDVSGANADVDTAADLERVRCET